MADWKRQMKNVAVWLCLIYLAFAPRVSAQTSTGKLDSDPLHQLNNSVRALVRRVTPCVVQVMVTGYGPVESSRGDTNFVFGKQLSVGSGVIIDPDGYIITNAHVLRGAHRVQVNIPPAANDPDPPDQSDPNDPSAPSHQPAEYDREAAPLHVPGAGTIGIVLLLVSLSVLFLASIAALLVIRSQSSRWPVRASRS